MEKRERRDRYRRNQEQNQRFGGRSHQGPNDSRDSRGDGRNDREKKKVADKPAVVEEKKVIDHTAIPDPHMFDHLKRETADIADLTAKKFGGKRQVFSNWAKYELPSEEFDDEQPIGSNFEELLQSAQLGSQPRWDPKGPVQSAAFTIDLGVLAASLACLPLYEKLDLPLDVFTTEELELMEKQARSGRESWKQKEELPVYASLLGKLTEIPSEKLVSELQSSAGSTISGSNVRRSVERTPDKEQTPDRDAEMSFDFGVIPIRGPSDSSLAPFRKERSVESPVTIMPSELPAKHDIPASVEVQAKPTSKPESEVAVEESLVTLSTKQRPVAVFAEEAPMSLPAKEPLGSLSVEELLPPSVEEPQLFPSPVSLEPKREQRLPNSQASREGQGRKKSRGSKNKRRSWGQDSEDAQPQIEEKKGSPTLPVATCEPTKGEASTETGRPDTVTNRQQAADTPETVQEQPHSSKSSLSVFDNKEKSYCDSRESKLQQPAKRETPLRVSVPKKEPHPPGVPKEKSRNPEMKLNPQQQVDTLVTIQVPSSSEPQMTSVNPTLVGQDNNQLSNQPNGSPKKDDDQLDFLLSLRKPVTAHQVMTFAAPTTAVRAAIDEDEPVTATWQPPVPQKKTEDLEDWLDTMLDD